LKIKECLLLTNTLRKKPLFSLIKSLRKAEEECYTEKKVAITDVGDDMEKKPNKALQRARELKGWSQLRLADELGTTESVVNRWEQGHHTPQRHFQTQLCELFGKNAEELGFLGEPEEVHKPEVSFYSLISGTSASRELPGESVTLTLFTLKQQFIQTLVAQWDGRAMYCDELQVILDQELRMFDLIQSLYHQEAYAASRRSVLTTLAMLPLTLITPAPLSRKLHPEELLPKCAASLTSCWYLLNGDSLATVEQTLPVYLPTLVTWARQSSRYQRVAATLAAQGSILMGNITYHRCHFEESLAYTNQIVEMAQIARDPNLLAYGLICIGTTHHHCQQPHLMLQKYQEAEQLLTELLPPLQSLTLAVLGHGYACNGMEKEALYTVGEAKTRFPASFGEVPTYVSADYNLSELVIAEGDIYLTLGENDADRISHACQQAREALGQLQTLSPEITVPERNRVQILNQQAQAAIGIGDLDETEHYLTAGMQGAIALGSDKRRQEVLANWQRARIRWPHERKLLTLADMMRE
jgi:transcriptional regulator with XRE-family HTH domain